MYDGLVGFTQRGIQAIEPHDALVRKVQLRQALLQLQAALLQLAHQHGVVHAEHVRLGQRGGTRRQLALPRRIHHRLHTLHENIRLGGFDDEGIGTHVEGQLFVLGFGVGSGIDDEGNTAQGVVRLPVSQQGVAVHDGHQQVADHEVGGLRARQLQGLGALVSFLHRIAMAAQQLAQQVAVLFAVVHHQGTHHRASGTKRSTNATNVCGSMGFSI